VSWIIIGLIFVAMPAAQDTVVAEPPGFRWGTHIELSYVSTGGNTTTRAFAGRLDVTGTARKDRLAFRSNGLYGRSDGEENTNRFLAEGRWERNISDGMFFFLNGTYLTDKFAGYDYRLFGGPGIGFILIASERQELRSLSSLNYTYDNYRFGWEESNTYANLDLAVEYRWNVTNSVTFKNSSSYATSLEDAGHYFVNSENSIEVKAGSFVSLGVSYSLAFQGKPPAADLKRLDTTFFSSLIFDF